MGKVDNNRCWRSIKACAFSLLLLPLNASADVYQWRNAQGKIHYSDQKPSNNTYRDISQRLLRINVESSHALRKGMSDVFIPVGSIEKQWLKEQKRQLVAQAEEACTEEQRVLSLLQGPVRIHDKNGDTLKVTEAQRQDREHRQQSKLKNLGCH